MVFLNYKRSVVFFKREFIDISWKKKILWNVMSFVVMSLMVMFFVVMSFGVMNFLL